MTNNTDPVRELIGEMTEYLDQQVDPELAVIAKWRDRLEAALASAPQPSFDRRFADMLIGILGDVQDELGFTDEEKLCANGSAEIVSAIRELKERAASAPPSAPVGVEDGPSDARDNAEYIEHCADKLERCGLRVTAGALRAIAHEHRSLARQPAAPSAEAVAWLRMTPDGTPDWAEDCIGSDDRFLDPELASDGYYLQPLYTAPQQPACVDESMVERAAAAVMSAPAGISVEAYVRIVLEAALAAQQRGGA